MFQECRHIMPTGAKCHSPAMRGMAYCFHHHPGRRPALGQSQAHKRPLKFPPLTDRHAVLVAIGQVLDAIGTSKITSRTANQLLYGLQTASNLSRPLIVRGTHPGRKRKVREPEAGNPATSSQQLEASS